jgi:hypothetical protein
MGIIVLWLLGAPIPLLLLDRSARDTALGPNLSIAVCIVVAALHCAFEGSEKRPPPFTTRLRHKHRNVGKDHELVEL